MYGNKHEVNKEHPELIVAYAYIRFIADLFGERIFPEVLTKSYDILKDTQTILYSLILEISKIM